MYQNLHNLLLLISTILLFQLSIAQEDEVPTCQEPEVLINGLCRCLPPRVKRNDLCMQIECPFGQYFDWTTYACETCHPSCGSCWGRNADQCTRCSETSSYNPVTGTCGSTCEAGFTGINNEQGERFCLYENCNSEMSFVNPINGQCESQCASSDDTLGRSPNGFYTCGPDMCDDSCAAFNLGDSGSRRACMRQKDFTTCTWCAEGYSQLRVSSFSDQNVYGCVNAQNQPRNTIFLADFGQYFYCQPQCAICSEATDNCLKCSDPSLFLLDNGSCQAECPAGMAPDDENPTPEGQIKCMWCDEICLAERARRKEEKKKEEELTTAVAQYHDVGGTMTASFLVALQIMRPGSSSTSSTILLVNLLQYVRYLSINYPSKLRTAFHKQPDATASLNFGPLFPESLNQDVLTYRPPSRFDTFNINALFLANFWRGVTTTAILALAVGFVLMIRRAVLKNAKMIMVREKLQSFLTWNYMITFTLSNLDRVTMFAIVEYQSLRLDSSFSIASFVLNVMFFIASILVLAYIPYRLYKIRKENIAKNEDKLKIHDGVKVMFEKAKTKYFFQEILVFMIGLRAVLHNLIIAAFDSPTAQASILMVISLLMIAYLIAFRPHTQLLENIELIIYEVIIFIVNSTCLHFSTLDASEQFMAYTASNTIIVCNILALSISILFSVLKVLVQVIKAIKDYLAAKKAKNTSIAQPKVESARKYYEKSPKIESGREKKREVSAIESRSDSNSHEKEDTILSLNPEIETEFPNTQNTISILKVNSSTQIVDTKVFPSFGISDEQAESAKMRKYFGEQPIRAGSMADLKIDSRNGLL